jgi:hypothetical protein
MRDANGVQTPLMYKPIPIFMSSNGYRQCSSITSTPVTLWHTGKHLDNSNVLYVGVEDRAGSWFILSSAIPKEICPFPSVHGAYRTQPQFPPFDGLCGFWMSRIHVQIRR